VAVVAVVAAGAGIAYVVMNDESVDGIVDGTGRVVNVGTSNRVVTTSATVAEIICGLGGYSKLVGVTMDSSYGVDEYIPGIPNDNYPKLINDGLDNGTLVNLGPMWEMSAESVLLANPDLVIMGGYFNSPATISALEDMGVPVVILKDDNAFDNIYFNIELVGKVIGKVSEAEVLVGQVKSAIGKIVDWTKSIGAPSQSVAVLMGLGGDWGDAYACGEAYILGTPLITTLGGTNAFSNISEMYLPVPTESILTADPDIIIDVTPATRAALDAVKTDPLLKEISASKNNRVYGAFESSGTAFTLTTQGFVSGVAMMAMFMYEDYLDFSIDNYLGSDYADYLKLFWEQVNA